MFGFLILISILDLFCLRFGRAHDFSCLVCNRILLQLRSLDGISRYIPDSCLRLTTFSMTMICSRFTAGLLENDSNLTSFFTVTLNRKRGKLKNCVFTHSRSFELSSTSMSIFFLSSAPAGIKRLFMSAALSSSLSSVLKIEKPLTFDVDRGAVEDLAAVSSSSSTSLSSCWPSLSSELANKSTSSTISCWVFVFSVDSSS